MEHHVRPAAPKRNPGRRPCERWRPGVGSCDAGWLGGLRVAPVEALDAAGGVDQLLLAGEERVAGAADLEPQLFLRRMRLEGVPAGADRGDQVQLRVDALSSCTSCPDLTGTTPRGHRARPPNSTRIAWSGSRRALSAADCVVSAGRGTGRPVGPSGGGDFGVDAQALHHLVERRRLDLQDLRGALLDPAGVLQGAR